jgi:hypothetical protein
MTEHEWLSCADVRPMLDLLASRPRRRIALLFGRRCDAEQFRRLSLFAAACFGRTGGAPVRVGSCQSITNAIPRMPARRRHGEATPWMEGAYFPEIVAAEEWAARWADASSRCVAWRRAYSAGRLDWQGFKRARVSERGVQATLLRCVYGNPFHSTEIDRGWLDGAGSVAKWLANQIAETDAFDRLPELADALEEAGCVDEALLAHCREPGPHARGCWAVEVLVGDGQRQVSTPIAQAILQPASRNWLRSRPR